MDHTRKQARVRSTATQAHLLATVDAARIACREMLDRSAIALAADSLGGNRKVLDMSVEYAKVREQFGRPIGSFQAIKHKCASMLVDVESSRSAAYYALWAASAGEPDAAHGRARWSRRTASTPICRRRREHRDPRWHRLHLGAPGASVPQAGQELAGPAG